LYVTKIDSVKSQLPFNYYHAPYCLPHNVDEVSENLGQILSGDSTSSSPYELLMKVQQTCKILCKKVLSQDEYNTFEKLVEEEYESNWRLDNLPGAVLDENGDMAKLSVPIGGKAIEGTYFLYNHLRFVIRYHQDPASYDGSRIVGFVVEPYTVKHEYEVWKEEKTILSTCNDLKRVTSSNALQPLKAGEEVVFTYDVVWLPSETTWATRWNVYFSGTDVGDNYHVYGAGHTLGLGPCF
jgi:transmembrane 9 superfamily protein 2/4